MNWQKTGGFRWLPAQSSWAQKIVVALSLLLIFTLVLVAENAQHVLANWGGQFQLVVDLKEEVPNQEVQNLVQQLRTNPSVAKVEHLTQQDSQKKMREEMLHLFPELSHDPEVFSFFPATLQIELKDAKDLYEKLTALSWQLEKDVRVQRASFGSDWVQTYDRVMGVAQTLGWVLSFVLLGGVLAILSSSIREAVLKSRNEIEVFELVGASPWQIRLPFFIQAVNSFLISLGLVLLSLTLLFVWVRENWPHLGLQFPRLATLAFVSLFLLCLFLAVVQLTLQKLNSGWSARERLRA